MHMNLSRVLDISKDNKSSLIEFFEISKDAFFILDKNFRIIYINPQIEDFLKIKKEEIIGKVLWSVFPSSKEFLIFEKYYKAINDRTPQFWEAFSRSINLWMEISAYPLKNEGFLVNVRDITKFTENALRENERKFQELIIKLRKANACKRDFISTLSHELRNPLATITMALSLIEHVTPGSNQDVHMREIIKRQTTQLIRLVDDLLDVTRIERNKIELAKENVEVNEIIKEALEEFKTQFSEKGVVLEKEYYDDFLYINADSVRIRQVISNLLSNSLKFTEKNGVVRLAVSKDDDNKEVVIKVSDTGIGIVPELLPDLFEPFVQADNSPARSAGGLGLGLSIVKGIIDLHGGSIVAKSEGLGKGSEFVIRLPLLFYK